MTKSLLIPLILSTGLLTACASHKVHERNTGQFAGVDCKALNAQFRNYDLNSSVIGKGFAYGVSGAEKSRDVFTLPWGDGGSPKEKISRTRAALRKAHKQQGCAN